MVIKNLENKVKLVTIICSLFLIGCVLISISSIWTAKNMVVDAQNKIYVLDGNVPILVQRTTMDETLDVEAKSHIEMFHHCISYRRGQRASEIVAQGRYRRRERIL